MSKCGDCKHFKDWDCHCPVPLSVYGGEYPLLQVNPTNPDRDASECACFATKERLSYTLDRMGQMVSSRNQILTCSCGVRFVLNNGDPAAIECPRCQQEGL